MNSELIINHLQTKFPELIAIYAFGSRIRGDAQADSDLDLAILVEGYADTLRLWETSNQLANELELEVDLLDFRTASTVMQYEILINGARWWRRDTQADLYEAAVLSEKTTLDTARAGLLDDIQQDGQVYAR